MPISVSCMDIYTKIRKNYKKHLLFYFFYDIIIKQFRFAAVAELADAPDSKSGGSDIVWVRVPPAAYFS